jgi:hypothetical protein
MADFDLPIILADHIGWLFGPGGERANLSEADLRGAYLYGADLREADLREADLREADLRRADLRGAILCDADLHGARITFRGRTVTVRFEEEGGSNG